MIVGNLKTILRAIGAILIATALVMMNLAIYYSSVPHFQQMGWAIFCGVNALWVGIGGVLLLFVADSHEVAMRQLDYNRRENEVSSR